jgi:Fic family protein
VGDLREFVAESNRIEGIHRVTEYEVVAHERLLALPYVEVSDLETFVRTVASRPLRKAPGMNVRVGSHFPPPGGPEIEDRLQNICEWAGSGAPTPWKVHVQYERLHPFLDGNGRSGRALWVWMRIQEDRDPFALGFLHSAYYEALEAEQGLSEGER